MPRKVISLKNNKDTFKKMLQGYEHIKEDQMKDIETGTVVRWVVKFDNEYKKDYELRKGGLLIINNFPKTWTIKSLYGKFKHKIKLTDEKTPRLWFRKVGSFNATQASRFSHENAIYRALSSEKFRMIEKSLLDYIESKLPEKYSHKNYVYSVVKHAKQKDLAKSKAKALVFPEQINRITKRLQNYTKMTDSTIKNLSAGSIVCVLQKNKYLYGPFIVETNAYPDLLELRSQRNPDKVLPLNLKNETIDAILYKKMTKIVDKQRNYQKKTELKELMNMMKSDKYRLVPYSWLKNVENMW